MNAQEAKLKAHRVNVDTANSQYSIIQDKISKAVEKGEYRTFMYESIKKDVKEKLEFEGYEITDNFTRNETTITISW